MSLRVLWQCFEVLARLSLLACVSGLCCTALVWSPGEMLSVSSAPTQMSSCVSRIKIMIIRSVVTLFLDDAFRWRCWMCSDLSAQHQNITPFHILGGRAILARTDWPLPRAGVKTALLLLTLTLVFSEEMGRGKMQTNRSNAVCMCCAHQAGASSMWASCCGLLNEVMGTGAVRGQQPGFGAGAGPFRFAPSAGYSTYPPTTSGSPSLVCKACGQAFSVFRRKVGPSWMLCLDTSLTGNVKVLLELELNMCTMSGNHQSPHNMILSWLLN